MTSPSNQDGVPAILTQDLTVKEQPSEKAKTNPGDESRSVAEKDQIPESTQTPVGKPEDQEKTETEPGMGNLVEEESNGQT